MRFANPGFWGKAGAGALVLAQDTGRVLFPQRSGHVNEPYTWGVWGGAVDPGEPPAHAAVRELGEEAGYSGEILSVVPLYVFKSGTFVYRNFLIVVPHEFEPSLNWESENAAWLPLELAPHPRHYGLEALLADAKSVRAIERASGRQENPIVPDVLYHVTFYGRLESIAEEGLVPGYAPTFAAFEFHSRGALFFSDEDALRGWFHKMHAMAESESDNPIEDGWIPVVLRVHAGVVDAEVDEEGSRDVPEGVSYRSGTGDRVDPENLEVWNGHAWAPLDEWESIDPELGVTRESVSEDDGTVELVWVDDADTSGLMPFWRDDWGPRRER